MRRAPAWLGYVRLLLLAAAFWPVAAGVGAVIDGEHYFRQTHVAANIETYVAGGLSLRPRTYNADAPQSAFDFPVFELGVAALCRSLGSDPLRCARWTNLGLLALTVLVFDWLLARTRVRPIHRLFAVVFFAFSPLVLYFFHTPIVDGLAIFLSLLSLAAFAGWHPTFGPPRRYAFTICLAAGIGATLVKNPTYLPVFLAILGFVVAQDGWRRLLRPAIVVYVIGVGLSLLAFRVYFDVENGASGLITSDEASAYFGDVALRFSSHDWGRILAIVARRGVCLVGFALALPGLAWDLRRAHGGRRLLYGALLAGNLATLLVFFNRYRWHSYYNLPIVLPLAFYAGAGVDGLRHVAARLVRGRQRALAGALPAAALVVVLGVTVVESRAAVEVGAGAPARTGTSTQRLVAAGDWLRERTTPDDFVAYVVADTENWNPAYLYFAKRDGYNLHVVELPSLPRLQLRYSASHRRFLVFSPDDCPHAHLVTNWLLQHRARILDQGPQGTLYWLEKRRPAGAADPPA